MLIQPIRRYIRTVKYRKRLLETISEYEEVLTTDFVTRFKLLRKMLSISSGLRVHKQFPDTDPFDKYILVNYATLEAMLNSIEAGNAKKTKEPQWISITEWLPKSDNGELSRVNLAFDHMEQIYGFIASIENSATMSQYGRVNRMAIYDLVSFYQWLYLYFSLKGKRIKT